MYPSSTLCRSQEEFHRERAASTALENVRAISAGAAIAWGLEAAAAEKREARGAKTRAIADLMAARNLSAKDAERQFSEGSGAAVQRKSRPRIRDAGLRVSSVPSA